MATHAQLGKLQQISKLGSQARRTGRKLKRGTPARKAIADDLRRYRKDYGKLRTTIVGHKGSTWRGGLDNHGGRKRPAGSILS